MSAFLASPSVSAKCAEGVVRHNVRERLSHVLPSGNYARIVGSAYYRMYSRKVRESSVGQRISPDTPVVHQVGWWIYQDRFELANFEVEKLEDMRSLANYCRIRITVNGEISRAHFVKEFYIREQFRDREDGKRFVEIVVVPVIGWKNPAKNAPENSVVTASADYILKSYQWFENEYRIVCGPVVHDVRCYARK